MLIASRLKKISFIFLLLTGESVAAFAAESAPKEEPYNPSPNVIRHISDSHEFHLFGNVVIPLPCFFYTKDKGWIAMSSARFEDGEKAAHGFATDHGLAKRIKEFPTDEEVALDPVGEENGEKEYAGERKVQVDGKETDQDFIKYQGKEYILEDSSKLFAATSWYDFSITKNVFSMILASLILALIFLTVANAYKKNPGKAPKGLQSLFEPLFIFLREDVARPNIGPKFEKYMPFLCSVFFFILINNLMGMIPLAPFGANVMGNISTTMVLALITFLIVNLSGNRNYWKHILWMPGVPTAVKFVMAPIELMSLFSKPFVLMVRLFANITAGHAIIVSLVSLVFVFGNAGRSVGGAATGAAVAIPFVIFINLIEILVVFLQAYIFTLLSAMYIGSAIEDHGDHHVLSHDEAHEHFVD